MPILYFRCILVDSENISLYYRLDMQDKVAQVLATTEDTLARLSGDYAAARDYELATAALNIASEISLLRNRWSKASEANPQAGKVAASFAAVQSPRSDSRTHSTRQKTKRFEYPKFYRRGDSLIKIGFSKPGGEYEHKAPKYVLLLLASAIQRAGAKQGRFSMNDILPLTAASGEEVPSYQPYLCLNWLRSSGLIRQHGRQGYSIQQPNDLPASIEAEWKQLTTLNRP
jgi:hypothetical protein